MYNAQLKLASLKLYSLQLCSELKEECGLLAKDLKKIGVLEFEFEGNEILFEVHVFETYKYCGEVIESEGI